MKKENFHQEIFLAHPLTGVRMCGRSDPEKGFRAVRVAFLQQGREVPSPDAAMQACARLIRSFLDGKIKDLSSIRIDLSGASPFARDVLLAARKIPWGSTVSYARLAQMSGHPKAVRAAASVMRRNPLPLIIPCHRVIRSDGSIGGFMGKMEGEAVKLKRKLIEREQ